MNIKIIPKYVGTQTMSGIETSVIFFFSFEYNIVAILLLYYEFTLFLVEFHRNYRWNHCNLFRHIHPLVVNRSFQK